ncbi:MAG: hypothetical protein A2X58_07325 [Nitrospirae bacterium GWC2_56_14]|nr:MAG: hypothetical protein A2X58_07325 [Nitrospirae bacterium GWC2_56_14]
MIMQIEKKQELLTGLLVAAIAFLVYANSLGNGFALDDTSVILNNPALRGRPSALFSSIDTTSDKQLLPFYRPLTYLTFYAEGRLHGFNPFLVRFFNVLLHSVNAFLVYRLARTLINDKFAALLVGLLFAVHPLHTEGVDFNAGGRNTMLACFFVLMAYLLHRRSIIRKNISAALAGAAFFLAGLFSKESAFAILPLIMAQEIIPVREKASGSRSRTAIRLLPYIAASTGYLVMRWMTLSSFGIQTSILPGISSPLLQSLYIIPGLTERLLNNLYILPRYLLTIIWPTALSSRYVVPDDLNLFALPLVSAWLCIIGILGWLFTRGRSMVSLFGLSWFALFWLPVSGIVYVPGAPLADRFLYIPAIGLWLAAADQISRLVPSGNAARKYTVVAATLVLIMLAILTVRRNLDWKNDITLYARFVDQYPDNAYGHVGLGTAYYSERRSNNSYLDLAERELEKALAFSQTTEYFPAAHNQLGHIKQNRGDYRGALYHYNEALAIFPYDKEARINRGMIYEKLGRYQEAVAEYQFYLSIPGENDIPGAQAYAEERVRELTR